MINTIYVAVMLFDYNYVLYFNKCLALVYFPVDFCKAHRSICQCTLCVRLKNEIFIVILITDAFCYESCYVFIYS